MNEAVKDYYLAHHGVKGQRWGVRRYQNKDGSLTNAGKKKLGIGGRYQNPDGSLTEEGEKRYERDILTNMGKKKENRIDTSKPDPARWEIEDLNNRKNVIDSSSKLIKDLNSLSKGVDSKKNSSKTDLSSMSDKELRDKINRKLLEQQYSKLYSDVDQVEVSKGKKAVQNTLEFSGQILTVASSAVALAVAFKQLKK